MQRRRLLTSAVGVIWKNLLLRITGLAGLIPLITSANPNTVFDNSDMNHILHQLFDTTEAGEDGGIQIHTAQDAESASRIPFRITARHSEKIAIFAEENVHPLILVADTHDYPEGVILGTVDLKKSSLLSCYVLRQGQLFSHSKFINVH